MFFSGTVNFIAFFFPGSEIYAFNDTIFSINKDNKIGATYYINFGNSSLKEIREDHAKVINSKILIKKNVGFLGDKVTFNDKYLMFSYNYKNRINYCIYNRASKKILRINKGIEDGLFKLLDYPLLISKDNKCYFAVSPELVIFLKEKYNKLYKRLENEWPELYKFVEKMSIDDNYFLLSFDLK